MEIGDNVFFITKNYGVKYGKIEKIMYHKDGKGEYMWYEVISLMSYYVTERVTVNNVFKSADEALAYLKATES